MKKQNSLYRMTTSEMQIMTYFSIPRSLQSPARSFPI